MTKRNTQQQLARKLQEADGIGYHQALNRAREWGEAHEPTPVERFTLGQAGSREDGEQHMQPSDARLIDVLRHAAALLPAGDEFLADYTRTGRFPGQHMVSCDRRGALAHVIYGLPCTDQQVFATDLAVTIRYANGHAQRFTRLADAGTEEHVLIRDAALPPE